MAIPESQRVIFKNNPLEEVVCQIRFPDILAIASETPAAFQERVRAEYPLYEQQTTLDFPDLQRIFAAVSPPKNSEVVHLFAAEDEAKTISLTRGSIALSDRRYERWEDFKAGLLGAMAALEDVYRPSFYTRVGLRYRDVVNPTALGLEGEPWYELVQPWLLGIAGRQEVRDQVRSSFSQVQFRLDLDKDSMVTLKHGLVQIEGAQNGYGVDSDFFSTGRFDRHEAEDLLDRFNRRAGDLFRWCITDKVREALEPVELRVGDARTGSKTN